MKIVLNRSNKFGEWFTGFTLDCSKCQWWFHDSYIFILCMIFKLYTIKIDTKNYIKKIQLRGSLEHGITLFEVLARTYNTLVSYIWSNSLLLPKLNLRVGSDFFFLFFFVVKIMLILILFILRLEFGSCGLSCVPNFSKECSG